MTPSESLELIWMLGMGLGPVLGLMVWVENKLKSLLATGGGAE